MGRCINTKFSGSVQNNSIIRVGEAKLQIVKLSSPTENTQKLRLLCGSDFSVRVDGKGYFAESYEGLITNPLTSITYTGSGYARILYFANDDYNVYIGNKYSQTYLGNQGYPNEAACLKGDLEQIAYCTSMQRILLTKCVGDVGHLSTLTSLQRLTLGNTEIYGDVSGLSNIQDLVLVNFSNCNVTGDIASSLPDNKITSLELYGSAVYGDIGVLGRKIAYPTASNKLFLSNRFSGSVESFVSSLNNNGYTSGYFNARNILNGIVTFGGIPYTVASDINCIYWNSDKIYICVGGDESSASIIYAKGCTQEEIAAWEAAGKTVVVVN